MVDDLYRRITDSTQAVEIDPELRRIRSTYERTEQKVAALKKLSPEVGGLIEDLYKALDMQGLMNRYHQLISEGKVEALGELAPQLRGILREQVRLVETIMQGMSISQDDLLRVCGELEKEIENERMFTGAYNAHIQS